MKKMFLIASLAIAAIATPALSQGKAHENTKGWETSAANKSDKAAVITRDAKGHPTVVSVNGKEYPVCVNDQSDGCINPREAGLNWGNRPLGYWPGMPASEGGKRMGRGPAG